MLNVMGCVGRRRCRYWIEQGWVPLVKRDSLIGYNTACAVPDMNCRVSDKSLCPISYDNLCLLYSDLYLWVTDNTGTYIAGVFQRQQVFPVELFKPCREGHSDVQIRHEGGQRNDDLVRGPDEADE